MKAKRRELTQAEMQAVDRFKKMWAVKKHELGLTQESAGLVCGWSGQAAFAQYLNGNVPLNVEAVLRIAKLLKVHPVEIMPEVNEILPEVCGMVALAMTTHGYETDIVAWANEQARLVRTGQFELLDVKHIAKEIEDVGKSEYRELASRLVTLIAHLLKWHFQPERQDCSWQNTIRHQRRAIQFHLKQAPSLKAKLDDTEWLEIIWGDAIYQASEETGLDNFPETILWSIKDILTAEWMPISSN